MRSRRIVTGYVLMLTLCAGIATGGFALGSKKDAQPKLEFAEFFYTIAGTKTRLALRQSGQFVDAVRSFDGKTRVADCRGKLRFRDGHLRGKLACARGLEGPLDLHVSYAVHPGAPCKKPQDTGAIEPDQEIPTLRGTLGSRRIVACLEKLPPKVEQTAGDITPEQLFGRLMLAIAAVILAARLVRATVSRIGQPPVMGEVLAGILLGPTLLGALLPEVRDYLFPPFVLPLLGAGANIGLAFYMFLVGLELDPKLLRGRVGSAALISNASIAFPLALGIAAAVPLYGLLAPDVRFVPFALFMGVAMSITAFPVLARILIERRMLKRPVGALAISAAAVDDVTAWGLLAIATGIAGEGSALGVLPVLGYVTAFCLAMALIVRPVLGRLSSAYDEAGFVPPSWIAAIFVGVLLAAYVAMESGVAPIFGAFVMGLIMPRRADLTHDVTRRLEDFVSTVLLPLFFVVTGLRVQIGLIDRPILWAVAALILAVAIVGKWFGAMVAARLTGHDRRESAVIGALMNTRGLTELIVLNIGLSLGVISPALFTILVIMALVTTFMAAPAIRLLDPRGKLSAPVEDELREAKSEAPAAIPVPDRSILVAPLEARNLEALLSIARPLARSRPPREVIIARLLPPPPVVTSLGPQDRELAATSRELDRLRSALAGDGIAARAVAFTSADRGRDLVRLASDQTIDLILLDGRRPLLGEGVPRGEVGLVLDQAPCDVAILVERERSPLIDEEHPVLVPFGGDEHDWAALELGAWIASASGAPLRLLGAAADPPEDERDASRLLANASLMVQRLAGVSAEPLMVAPGREGVIAAAEGAGLLVVGLSERWRAEGLGPTRSAVARAVPAPTLFIRRGRRPGALAPAGDLTRYTWSSVGA